MIKVYATTHILVFLKTENYYSCSYNMSQLEKKFQYSWELLIKLNSAEYLGF